MNTKIRKGILNAIIFLFFVGLTLYIILKDNRIVQILQTIKQVDLRFIFVAIFCMFFFIFAEGINIARTLKLLNCKISLKNGIKYALVGFFFSSVTPSASGGDPMQIYYMKKDGLAMGHSALAILTEFSSFQFVTVVMSLIGFIGCYDFIEHSVGNIKYLLILGVAINVAILAVVLIMIFSKRFIVKMVDFICKILEKFHYKKVDEFREKCLIQVQEYKAGANLLAKNKKVLVKILGTTMVQIVLYHSIPYMIYLAFGLLGGANYFQFLALQAVLYISVSAMPLPGAVGVSEGGFLGIYQLLFPSELLVGSMLLSRGISFYLFVIISGVFVLWFSFKGKKWGRGHSLNFPFLLYRLRVFPSPN